jgi:flagellar biosynthesis protein FlhA
MIKNVFTSIGKTFRYSDLFMAMGVVCVLFLLIIPLTDFGLDFLISISIVISVLTLLVTLYTEETLSFNSFPSFLLLLTLFRLGLNIASTRMILTEGHAGNIIKTFGEVVTGGNPFVGFVIFLLLTGINFVVITKGSGRVAEVAARFTLDSLPGKQLAIDADVNAGLINESEAKERRDKIVVEADFYGAMDGASKFVRGDAIAGIVIILVNILGGFIVGMAMKGMSWDEVVKVYITLTVGDGLVTQIPALLVSIGAGIIVTRSSTKENLAEAFKNQLFNNPKVLAITATILLLIGCVPGIPLLVILPIVLVLYLYAYYLSEEIPSPVPSELSDSTPATLELQKKNIEAAEKVLAIEPMEIELGPNLISLIRDDNGSLILKRIALIRKQIAAELGIMVPSIRIHDNLNFNPDVYCIKIKEIEVASGSLYIHQFLAMNPGNAMIKLAGNAAYEPVFGLPAIWISPEEKKIAINGGYIVVDPLTVLLTHLTEVIRSHAYELLTRQEVSHFIESTRQIAPTIISELIPLKITMGQIMRVLENLLRERVSIRDIVTILEIITDHVNQTTDPDILSEYVRIGLARSVTLRYLSPDKKILAILIDPKVEELLLESLETTDFGKSIKISPFILDNIIDQINTCVQAGSPMRTHPVLLTSSSLRFYFKRLIANRFPRLAVLSVKEITPDVEIETLGIVSADVFSQV